MRHDDAVLVLAKAKVGDAAKVLAVLLKADEPLTVSLLADINRSKAEALIAALPADGSASEWLRELPEASEAIGNCAVQMRWDDAGNTGQLERAAKSSNGTEGGTVFERPAWPVAVPAATMELIFRDRELWDRLGFPASEEEPAGIDGANRIQFFENGNVTLRGGKREIWLRPETNES
jgi:hypothetical protein